MKTKDIVSGPWRSKAPDCGIGVPPLFLSVMALGPEPSVKCNFTCMHFDTWGAPIPHGHPGEMVWGHRSRRP